MPKVVITLPAYRAARTVAKTVADVPPDLSEHMILVDDASPDETVELARSLGLRVFVHTENRGYGANLKTCYLKALEGEADIVVVLHPDYQYDPKAVPLLIAPILAGDADMTFGSRFAGIGDPLSQGMPFYRFLGNRVTTVLQNAILGTRFTEMHSGMRAYRRECLLSLPFLGYSDDFVFESQILVDAVAARFRVVEVPIPTRYTLESSSLNLEGLFRYVWGSIIHTAVQTARWGRRGRRWPSPQSVSGRRRPTGRRSAFSATSPSASSLATSKNEAAIARVTKDVLARLQQYRLPGITVALLAPSSESLDHLMAAGGWEPSRDPTTRADAVLALVDPAQRQHLGTIAEEASRSLVPDGLLALVTSAGTRRSWKARAAAELDAGGFRVIGWGSSRAVGRGWVALIARQKAAPSDLPDE